MDLVSELHSGVYILTSEPGVISPTSLAIGRVKEKDIADEPGESHSRVYALI